MYHFLYKLFQNVQFLIGVIDFQTKWYRLKRLITKEIYFS